MEFNKGVIHFTRYLFPVSYMEGLHVDFEQITSWMLFNNAHDYEMYIKRLEAIAPRVSR